MGKKEHFFQWKKLCSWSQLLLRSVRLSRIDKCCELYILAQQRHLHISFSIEIELCRKFLTQPDCNVTLWSFVSAELQRWWGSATLVGATAWRRYGVPEQGPAGYLSIDKEFPGSRGCLCCCWRHAIPAGCTEVDKFEAATVMNGKCCLFVVFEISSMYPGTNRVLYSKYRLCNTLS